MMVSGYNPAPKRSDPHAKHNQVHPAPAAHSKINIHTLKGGLNGEFNQQWASNVRRERSRYAYLEHLSFIDWSVLKPPPPPKKKRASKSKNKDLSPEELAKLKAKNDQKAVEAERERAEAERLAKQRAEITHVFNSYSGGGSTITLAQAAAAARSFGYAPDMEDLLKLESATGNRIDMDALMSLMAASGSHVDDADDLVEFFRSFDRSRSGKLHKNQISNLMRTYGEPLTKEEMNCLFDLCGLGKEEYIDYTAFVKMLTE